MEEQVLQLLQQAPNVLFSAKEVSKKLDRKRYREEPSWARPILKSLVERKLIEEESSGYFCFRRH